VLRRYPGSAAGIPSISSRLRQPSEDCQRFAAHNQELISHRMTCSLSVSAPTNSATWLIGATLFIQHVYTLIVAGVLFNAMLLVGWMSVIGAVSMGYRDLIEDRTVRR
jgi:hypothetical protein